MDTVRFGRALGFGARAAARTVVAAVDAATAPAPAASRPPQQQPSPSRQAGVRAAQTVQQARQTSAGVARGGKRFGEAVWGPFARVSGVLWLEVTGVFFGLFALLAGTAAWSGRAALHLTGANLTDHRHLLFSCAMALLFAYFCISSFVRANRKSRKPKP